MSDNNIYMKKDLIAEFTSVTNVPLQDTYGKYSNFNSMITP